MDKRIAKTNNKFRICNVCDKEKELDKSFYIKKWWSETQQKEMISFGYICKECIIKKRTVYIKKRNFCIAPAMEGTKICYKCKKKKDIKEFHAHKTSVDGRRYICKECRVVQKPEISTEEKAYKILLSKEMEIARNVKYSKMPKNKVHRAIKDGIRWALIRSKGKKGGQSWESMVDYTTKDLMKHLEKLFKPGMTWDNYGSKWHIDHKIPVSAFNFTTPEHSDFKKCWALSNLQPLWKIDNLKKSNKLSKHFQPSLLM